MVACKSDPLDPSFPQPVFETVQGDYVNMEDFSFPDLSQYAKNSRARGELKDGCLMTLTTNCSKIFSEDPSGCWAILMSRTIIMMMKRIFL